MIFTTFFNSGSFGSFGSFDFYGTFVNYSHLFMLMTFYFSQNFCRKENNGSLGNQLNRMRVTFCGCLKACDILPSACQARALFSRLLGREGKNSG